MLCINVLLFLVLFYFAMSETSFCFFLVINKMKLLKHLMPLQDKYTNGFLKYGQLLRSMVS